MSNAKFQRAVQAILEDELVPSDRPDRAASIEAFLEELDALTRHKEMRGPTRGASTHRLAAIQDLAAQLFEQLESPPPELYGAMLELSALAGGRSAAPLDRLRTDLALLQRALSTAKLDAYRKARPADRTASLVRFLAYRVAVLLDSHFGEGTATETRGSIYDRVLREVLARADITPPPALTRQVMPQALRVLHADQASMRASGGESV